MFHSGDKILRICPPLPSKFTLTAVDATLFSGSIIDVDRDGIFYIFDIGNESVVKFIKYDTLADDDGCFIVKASKVLQMINP